MVGTLLSCIHSPLLPWLKNHYFVVVHMAAQSQGYTSQAPFKLDVAI